MSGREYEKDYAVPVGSDAQEVVAGDGAEKVRLEEIL